MSADCDSANKATPSPVVSAILFKVASTALFATMGAMVRSLQEYPTGQLVVVRNLFALIPILVAVYHAGGWRVLKTDRPVMHLQRSVAGLIAMFCVFFALTQIPLADVTAIGFAVPLFTTILAALILGEVVRRHRWAAVAAGFVGVLLILQPSGLKLLDPAALAADPGYPLGAGVALVGAFFIALALTAVRRMAGREASVTIVFYFTMTCTVAGLATLPFAFALPASWADAALMVGVGVVGGLAQLCLTASYQRAGTSVVAPFDYTQLLWALLIGYAVFGELPEPIMLGGAAIVIAAGLYILHRERRHGLERGVPTG